MVPKFVAFLSYLIVVNWYTSSCNIINTDKRLSQAKRHLYKRAIWTSLKTLFRGAKLMTKSEDLQLFYKSGGYKRALEDFAMLKPNEVKLMANGERHGKIGNTYVLLKMVEGHPTLVITSKSNRVFVYTDNYYFGNSKLQ